MEPSELLAPSARRGPRWRIGVGAAIVLVLLAAAIAVVAAMLAPAASVTELEPSGAALSSGGSPVSSTAAPPGPATGVTAAPTPQPTGLVVHVVGAVVHPGVYELPAGSRAIDAVAAAGGFTAKADRGAQNLASRLADGEQLYVPKAGESPPPSAAGAPGDARGGVVSQPGGGASVGAGPVNLNTADEVELETLPHVGPAMAQKIIAWREANGGFASVDDLQNVSGIGPKTFDALKALVTV